MRFLSPGLLAVALLTGCRVPPDAADGPGPAGAAAEQVQSADAAGAARPVLVPLSDALSVPHSASGGPRPRLPAASASRSQRPWRSSVTAPSSARSVKAVVEEQAPEVLAAVESALALVRSGQLGIGLAALEGVHAGHPAAAGPALATVLHQQALNQYGRGELRAAEQLWLRVLSVDADHPTARRFSRVVRDELGARGGRLAAPGR